VIEGKRQTTGEKALVRFGAQRVSTLTVARGLPILPSEIHICQRSYYVA